jgi:hypothetical protein
MTTVRAKQLQEKIISTALKHVGMKEIKGNQGWHWDKFPEFAKKFEEAMKSHGFSYGQAWCAYFSEHIFATIYDEEGLAREIDKYFSGSARRTLSKFSEAEGWMTGTVPMEGAVVIWKRMKNGKATWQGHAGIVIEVHDGYMVTVEGNTNAAGSREGDMVAKKTRKYNFTSTNGLALEGFVYPKGLLPHIPFESKAEGDKFRGWVNDNYPDYAKAIDLDRKGSWFNSFITKAYFKLGKEYTNG